jgi:HPt (histidine-containing phosphotransfer) domain-containing protein
MSYTTSEGRERIAQDLSQAAAQIELVLAYLGEAYEQLDTIVADRLEEELFSPAQGAYARLSRTRSEFVARYDLVERRGDHPPAAAPRTGARTLIEAAADAIEQADHWIAELQDTMLPVEVGDQQLRAGLAATRSALTPLPARARELVRTVGR